MKCRQIKFFFMVFLLILVSMPKNSFADLHVPISISEAKPTDVIGVARNNGPVTCGIPLLAENNITDISQLGLTGASVGQFRVLKCYPGTGKIWWVLVDTQLSIDAGGTQTIFLTDSGIGNFGGNALATEDTNFVIINTGVATFKLKKQNFNFIDSAVINGNSLISAGHLGGVEIESNNTVYSSIYDNTTQVSIEENGPVRTCIKIYGRLADPSGNPFMGYTLRMHFYKNKTYVKTYFTLRNAYRDSVTAKPIKRAGVVLHTNLGSSIFYELSKQDTTVAGTLDGVKYLFQGIDDTYYSSYGDGYVKDRITSFNGLDINGTTTNEYSQGWGEIKNSSNVGVTAAMRWMSFYWPAGIEINTNIIEIDSLSQRNPMEPKFSWGVWETRELLHDFHISTVNNQNLIFTFQYPLVGKVLDFEWYRQTKALLDHEEWLTLDEQQQYHTNKGITFPMIKSVSTDLKFQRFFAWAMSGGVQSDVYFDDLFNFLRTGNGVLWHLGEQSAIHKANHAIVHSDEFDYKTANELPRDEIIVNYFTEGRMNSGSYNFNFYDGAHPYQLVMYLYYYLSGNEQIKEAIYDFVECLDYNSDYNIHCIQQGGQQGDLRGLARTYRSFALFHDFLEDSRSLNIMKTINNIVLKKRDDGVSIPVMGRDLDRGYYINIWYEPDGRYIKDFFLAELFIEALERNINVFDRYAANYENLEDLKDFYLGLAYFIKDEFTGGGNDGHTYAIYTYQLDEPNDFNTSQRPCFAGYAQAFGYKQTGNPDFLFTGWLEQNSTLYYPGTYQAWEKETQALMYMDLHRNMPTKNFINPIGDGQVTISSSNVTNNGDGSYTLSWTVPAGGVNEYQIKFAEQPMVQNLNYNQLTRIYEYDPNIYDNFWAALNISDEPTPANPASTQTYTLNIQQKINDYNQRYQLTSANPAYVAYNASKVYHFAIKYTSLDNDKPGQVSNLSSNSHSINILSINNIISLCWAPANDSGGSGLNGYSIIWDTITDTVPDKTRDIGAVTNILSPTLPDGNNHYFHIRAVDGAGNWSDDAAHIGPFFIEATAPVITITYNKPVPYKDTDMVILTALFSEKISGIPQIAIDYVGENNDVSPMDMSATNDEKVWIYSIDIPPEINETATITITGQDAAGNPAEIESGDTYVVDNIPSAPQKLRVE